MIAQRARILTQLVSRLSSNLHKKEDTTHEIALLDTLLLSKGVIIRPDETNSYVVMWVPLNLIDGDQIKTPLALAHAAAIIYTYDVASGKAKAIKNRFGEIGVWFEYTKRPVEAGQIVDIIA